MQPITLPTIATPVSLPLPTPFTLLGTPRAFRPIPPRYVQTDVRNPCSMIGSEGYWSYDKDTYMGYAPIFGTVGLHYCPINVRYVIRNPTGN